jgi:hypothetical protein
MKPIITNIILGMFLIACQEDIDVDTSNNDTNNKESVFTSKAERNSMFDGLFDDVLDQTPCSAVNLPVNIELNNIQTTVGTLADLELINPGDAVSFIYPITVTTYDYKTQIINNEEEFGVLQNACSDLIENDKGPISCVEIEFPISVFTILDHNQQNKLDIPSKQAFYLFLDNLSSSELYSIDYPITIQKDGSSIPLENDASYLEYLDSCDDQ